jgi:hypothetical protein
MEVLHLDKETLYHNAFKETIEQSSQCLIYTTMMVNLLS